MKGPGGGPWLVVFAAPFVAVSLVALLLPLAAATSLADTGPAPTEDFKFSSNGYSAFVSEGNCTTDGDIETCTFNQVDLFSGNRRDQGSGAIHGAEVCYNTGTDVFNPVTGEVLSSIQEFGCTRDVGDGTVIERDLSAATIAPTTITIETCRRGRMRPDRGNARRHGRRHLHGDLGSDPLVFPQRLRRRHLHLPR